MTRINAAAASGLPKIRPALNRTRARATGPAISEAFIDPQTVPDVYASVCAGDCMAPTIPDGARVWCDKRLPIGEGDLVGIFLRREVVTEGGLQMRIKRLVVGPPSWVKFPHVDHPQSEVIPVVVFGMDNPRANWTVPCSHILAIHRCMGLVPPEIRTYRDDQPGVFAYGQEPRPSANELPLSAHIRDPMLREAFRLAEGDKGEAPTATIAAPRNNSPRAPRLTGGAVVARAKEMARG